MDTARLLLNFYRCICFNTANLRDTLKEMETARKHADKTIRRRKHRKRTGKQPGTNERNNNEFCTSTDMGNMIETMTTTATMGNNRQSMVLGCTGVHATASYSVTYVCPKLYSVSHGIITIILQF